MDECLVPALCGVVPTKVGTHQSALRALLALQHQQRVDTGVEPVHAPVQVWAGGTAGGTAGGSDIFASFVMFVALSFHSFLAGLSLGANPEGVSIFVAIIAHKFFEAFALGTSFVRAKGRNTRPSLPNRQLLFCMLLFSSVTPIGVLVGNIVADAGDSKVHTHTHARTYTQTPPPHLTRRQFSRMKCFMSFRLNRAL